MSRNQLLTYVKQTHGAALQAVGVALTDDQESLAYVLFDALTGENDAAQKAIADREVERLIIDKAASLPIPQEVTDVSNE